VLARFAPSASPFGVAEPTSPCGRIPFLRGALSQLGNLSFHNNQVCSSELLTNALIPFILSLRATYGSVPARRSAAFRHAGVAILLYNSEIASSFHSSQ